MAICVSRRLLDGAAMVDHKDLPRFVHHSHGAGIVAALAVAKAGAGSITWAAYMDARLPMASDRRLLRC